MNLELCVQFAIGSISAPEREEFEQWVKMALQDHQESVELTIRVVDETESGELNQTYRHKSGPTNVLSFPFQAPTAGLTLPLLGDIVICAPVVEQEAKMQNKNLSAHWAHMVIHGTLHLLGYDHQKEAQALEMERLETRILQELGYPDPYGDEHYL